MAKRILSGMRPTGKLHLGNLLGALENWKKFEGQDVFFMIADWHALTTDYESKTKVREQVKEVILDYLAAGLDPKRVVIFLQSLVPQHAELALLLAMITPLPWLERNPTYKDQLKEPEGRSLSTYGFLGYPVLQAADILLYQANTVPVGEDQLPHLELAREIARRFNFLYGPVFTEPEALLTETPRIPGLDGRKMSKSYGNTIELSDSPKEVDKKVMQMVTDPARKRREDKGHPEVCPVYFFHTLFNKENQETVARECRTAERGCVECKREMASKLVPFMEPIYERRRALEPKKDSLAHDILIEGSKRAGTIAAQTFEKAKEAAGIGI